MSDRADRIGPADDAEPGQQQAVNRNSRRQSTAPGQRPARCHGHRRPAPAQTCAASHSTPPIASAASTMRGSRRRAAASIENPNSTAPCRIKVTALLHAPARCRRRCRRRHRHGRAPAPGRSRPQIPSTSPISGVNVSSRAKKDGDSALTSTWAGRASASHISACAVAAVSAAVKAPCSNSIRTMGSREHDQSQRRRQCQADGKFERARLRHARPRCGRRRAPRASVPAPARHPWRRRQCRAAIRSGGWRNTATIPPPAMTTRSRRRRRQAIAGLRWRSCRGSPCRESRASRRRTRCAAASRVPPSRRQTRIRVQQPGDADRGRHHQRGKGQDPVASPAARSSRTISAMLNRSGENAVSAKRPCAFNTVIITVTGPGKSEIGQHQAGIVDRPVAASDVRQNQAREQS